MRGVCRKARVFSRIVRVLRVCNARRDRNSEIQGYKESERRVLSMIACLRRSEPASLASNKTVPRVADDSVRLTTNVRRFRCYH